MKDVAEADRIIPEDLGHVVAWAKHTKTSKVEGTKAGEMDDIAPVLSLERGGRHIALVFCRDVDRDEALQAACAAVPLFGADSLDVLLDVHIADQEFVERYGRTPDPLELQNLCDNEGACEIGLISDGIAVLHVERGEPGAHPIAHITLPYHVHKTARECHWIDDKIRVTDTRGDTTVHARGIVVRGLYKAFDNPRPTELMGQEGIDPHVEFGLTDDEIEIHSDCAAVGLLGRLGFAVAYAPKNEEHAAIFESSMARSGTLTYTKGGVRDGEWVEPDLRNLSPLDVLGQMAAEKLLTERQRIHEREVTEAARRRAERASGNFIPETPGQVMERLSGRVSGMDTEGTVVSGNREQRRAAARAKRK